MRLVKNEMRATIVFAHTCIADCRNAFNTGERSVDLRGRRESCDEDEYFESIDKSGVNMDEFQKYFDQCDSFFSDFDNAILNGSVCNDQCLQPSLEFFRLVSGPDVLCRVEQGTICGSRSVVAPVELRLPCLHIEYFI